MITMTILKSMNAAIENKEYNTGTQGVQEFFFVKSRR